MKVIEVQKKKQRVNDGYLQMMDDEDDYGDDEYYEDDEYGEEANDDEIEMLEMMTGVSQDLLARIVMAGEDDAEAARVYEELLRHLNSCLGPAGSNPRNQDANRYVDGLTNEQIDLLTFESVKYFLIKKLNVRSNAIESWDRVTIIPERLRNDMREAIGGLS